MGSFSYSGYIYLSTITNNTPRTVSLSASESATGYISGITADAGFLSVYSHTYRITATLNFSDGATAMTQKTVTSNANARTPVSFSFSNVSVAHANSIVSITFVSPDEFAYSADELSVDGTITVTVNYLPHTKVSDPAISVGTTATDSSSVYVSWTASTDGAANTVTGYILECADSSNGSSFGSWANYGTYGATTRSVYATLPEARKYRKFRVRATGSAGSEYYSDWSESSAVYRYATPSAPSNLTATPATWESGSVTLAWNASSVSGAYISNYYIQYRLKRYGGSFGSWTNLANTSNTTYSYNPDLQKGDSIEYRVRALSNEGVYSGYSSSAAVSRPTDKPKNLTPAAGWYETIDVCSWELPAAIDLTGTVCQYCYSADSGATWSAWANASGKSFNASSLFAGVASGAYFAYKVRAVQTNGDTSEETLSPSIYKNSAPFAPVVIAPVSTQSNSPGAFWAVISVSTDPNGHTMTAAYKRNNGDLVTIASGLTEACVLAVKLTRTGRYTFRVTDEYGAYSETVKPVTVIAETYTDDPVTAGTTRIKAAHINELRSRIEQLCTLYGVTAPTWDEAIVAGTTSVKHFPAHIEELREAIEAIYAVINNMGAGTVIASPSWAAALTDIKPKAAAIEEVRAAARAI